MFERGQAPEPREHRPPPTALLGDLYPRLRRRPSRALVRSRASRLPWVRRSQHPVQRDAQLLWRMCSGLSGHPRPVDPLVSVGDDRVYGRGGDPGGAPRRPRHPRVLGPLVREGGRWADLLRMPVVRNDVVPEVNPRGAAQRRRTQKPGPGPHAGRDAPACHRADRRLGGRPPQVDQERHSFQEPG